jgi:endonuclease YncB( thermonuclease family)
MPRRALLLLCGASLLGRMASTPARQSEQGPLEGMALDVQDGDSFDFRSDGGVRLKIRVSGIDAPERQQPFADASRRHLGTLLRGRRLRIEPVKRDVYDRLVARVIVMDGVPPERDAGLAQLEAGLAWYFKRYRADLPQGEAPRYWQAEAAARKGREGLWQDAGAEAPLDFRARGRRGEAAPAAAALPLEN